MNTSTINPIDSNITSGQNKSFWNASTEPIIFEKLNQNIETDILIVGGGISGLTTAGDYLQEVGNMVAQYADWVTEGDVKDADELKPGHRGIISSGMKKIAAYRDEQNNLHTCIAVCPHLGAILQWNADEKSFDCPAHGSRFTTEGKIINGPATADLKKVEVKEENKMLHVE